MKHSEATKQKMSLLFSGDKNPMFNKNHSEETKAKMSQAKKAYWANRKEKQQQERERKIAENKAAGRAWNAGLKTNKETLKKMKQARERRKKQLEEERERRLNEEIERLIQEQLRQKELEKQIKAEDPRTAPITPEEFEMPMILIASKRKITMDELNKIFCEQFKINFIF